MSFEILKNVLHSGVWGTIGPYSLKAAELIARLKGVGYCLLTHSAGTALEAVLRAVGAYHGERILVPAAGARIVQLSPNLTGAQAVMCGSEGSRISLADVESSVRANPAIKCAVLDFEFTEEPDKIHAYLSSAGITFILWAGGRLREDYKGVSLCACADAVIYSFAEGADVYAGNAGAVVTDSKKLFDGAYAAHNCGRVLGEGATLNVDEAIGGDMRITEWQAAVIYDALSK